MDKRSLAEFIADVGTISTVTPFVTEKLFSFYSATSKKPLTQMLSDSEIAHLLTHLVASAAHPTSISKGDLGFIIKDQRHDIPNPPSTWSTENLFSVILQTVPDLNFKIVLKCLDSPSFEIRDYQAVAVISTAFNMMAQKSPIGFPASTLFEKWQHPKAQFSLIVAIVRFMPELLISSKDVHSFTLSPDTSKFPTNLIRSPWNVTDLIRALIGLFKTEIAPDVLAFIDAAWVVNPELMLLGLAHITIEELQQGLTEIVLKLTQIFIAGHPSSTLVIPRLWELSPNILISGMIRIYSSDVYSLSRILDISQELKVLPRILEAKPYFFAIDLAALASRRDFLNLEKWLQDHIRSEGPDYLKVCLQFLHEKIVSAISRNDKSVALKPSIPLSAEVVTIFFRVLNANQNSMTQEEIELVSKLISAGQQMGSRLLATSAANEEHPTAPNLLVSKEVEEETSALMEKLYKREVLVSDVVIMLKQLQKSQNIRDQEYLKCIIQNLFEEYKYYAKYPEKELMVTSTLFGAMIQNDLLTGNFLPIGLRMVLESLRTSPDSNLFKFGSQAIKQYHTRLAEWPQLVTLLLQIEQLKQSMPELYSQLERLTKLTPATTLTTEIFTSIQIDHIESERKEPPNEKTQDKILFIINNVSADNIESKIIEMKEILDGEIGSWFGSYLVEKRISIEPNFHNLYVQFLDGISNKDLETYVFHHTLKNVKSLINSEKTITSSADRTLLKNLGAWLGFITLAKNRPIKYKNIAFKELLLEGYDSNRLIVTIPFVCKVLEQAEKSLIFKPPNPWLMSIMKLLAELYHYAELKLNLKFEIEVLCKTIKLDVKGNQFPEYCLEISPTNYLRDRPVRNAPTSNNLTQGIQKLAINHPDTNATNLDSLISSIIPFITFNPSVPIFNTNIMMRKLVILAITKAIEEILAAVVERSVTIAGIATKELVIKDFAMEPDENKMRKAAHMMAQSLAGNLASVTCREPLRVNIIQNLRAGLLQSGYTEQTLPDMFIIVSDNLDLACSVIEKSASEKAIEEVDKNLFIVFETRKKHRERSAQPYFDQAVYSASRYPAMLRESLNMRPTGVTPIQFKVYEDFLRSNRPSETSDRTGNQTKIDGHTTEEAPVNTMQSSFEKFLHLFNDLESAIASSSSSPTLFSQPSIQMIVKQMRVTAVQSGNRDDSALLFAQKIVESLFQTESEPHLQVCAAALEKILELSTKAAKEVNSWFIYANDPRKHNIAVYKILLETGVLVVSELDIQIARLLDVANEESLKFISTLLSSLCIVDGAPFKFTDFFISTNFIRQYPSDQNIPDYIATLSEMINAKSKIKIISDDTNSLRILFSSIFEDWMAIFSHPSSNETIQTIFIRELYIGVLHQDEISALFYRVCIESSVEKHKVLLSVPNIPPAQLYSSLDSFSRLIVLLIKNCPENPPTLRTQLASKILSIVVMVLVDNHEKAQFNFNQKAFFRFFCSLYNNLHAQEESLQSCLNPIISTISNMLHALRPSVLPAFTFSWLQLISHRYFMPKLLKMERGWHFFQLLLSDLFKFLCPFLTNDFSESIRYLYRGTLRVLLVLLHDFPEFLCSYHFNFMDHIPTNCIQMRNLILSAFPGGMRLPDPFTPNLKVDLLPEIHQAPTLHSDYTATLVSLDIKTDLDNYLKNPHPSFCTELKEKLYLPHSKMKFQVKAINAVVLYSGIYSLAQLEANGPSSGPLAVENTSSMGLYVELLRILGMEGRYLLLSAMANQLRYPNSHTHFFSCALFYLFLESDQEIIKEQITRVLLERLIVNRPHPYGLLITFIELIRNPKYKFWDYTSFIRCAPEIERLFSSVAKSINSSFAV